MPRASDGTYSLPAGNPVTTLTTISTTWANTTLDDLGDAMTDSLSRSGDGAMLAALELAAGAVGAPALSFSAEATTGLYRAGAGDIRFAVSGADVLGIATNLLRLDGTAPVFRFDESDATADNGVWQAIATGESFKLQALTDALVATTFLSVERTAGVVDGISMTGADFTYTSNGGGVYTLQSNTSGVIGNTGLAPEYRWTETDGALDEKVWALRHQTGVLNIQTRDDALGLGTAAVSLHRSGTTPVAFRVFPTADTTSPCFAFTTDQNTGINRPAADQLGIVAGGSQAFLVSANGGFTLDTSGGTSYKVGYRDVPQNAQNGNYTCVAADAGKHVYKASGGAGETITIPANASVAYDVGTVLTFINQGGGTLTIAITTDTMTMAGTGSTGSRTLADDGIATAIKVAATEWFISGTGLS